MIDQYAALTDEEYDRRRDEKIDALVSDPRQRGTLLDLLWVHCWDELTELFNNEILDEWAAEQDDDGDGDDDA